MELALRNRVALVTGASRGIGAEIARELAREGCSLVLTARNARELHERADEVRALGVPVLVYAVDLCAAGAASEIIAAALLEFGRLDFIVANAGDAKQGDFLEVTDEMWQQAFALKFFAHVRLLRAAWPHLKAQQGGILIIAGVSGRTPGPAGMVTGAVNAALLSVTKGLAARGIADGVQVNAVSPGSVRTARYQQRVLNKARSAAVGEEEAERRIIAEEGVTRIGEVTDIAGLVSFILSQRGSLLQGALIDIDGGRTKTI